MNDNVREVVVNQGSGCGTLIIAVVLAVFLFYGEPDFADAARDYMVAAAAAKQACR